MIDAAAPSATTLTPFYSVAVAGKSYGPYRPDQMRDFIAEGRITANSVVSRNGGAWGPASADETLKPCFAPKPPVSGPAKDSAPALKAQRQTRPVREALLKELEGLRSPASFGSKPRPQETQAAEAAAEEDAERAEETTEPVSANLLLIYNVKSHSAGRLEEAIMALGAATKIQPGIWVLNAPYSAGSVRNQLIEHFAKSDTLFVVDATNDKVTWFNFGPELDARIRRVWKRN
jgi:hypothetical protein